RGPERAGLQPLRGHALLLEQLSVQGARVQLLRLRGAREGDLRLPRAVELAAQPGRDGALTRGDGEVHDVHPAHPRGQGERARPAARAEGRRDPDRLPAVVPDAGDHVRRPAGSREPCGEAVARPARVLGTGRAQHRAGRHLSQGDRAVRGRIVSENENEITYEVEMRAEDVGAAEHVPATVTQKSLTADCLRLIQRPGWLWWVVFLFDLAVLAVALVAERNQIVMGIGVAGHTRPVMWASYVTNFVFWVGIAH